ncbi:MAG: hypothetical protein G8237_01320 [Magnetococcales bacterium]|nr:hypothetical protein [Magnetococcales bacterium]NGZ04977.1 hypothetical protein [Magnetococcales bacterium]
MRKIVWLLAGGMVVCLSHWGVAGSEVGVHLAGPTAAKSECQGCHAWRNPERTRRALAAPHDRLRMQHGQGDLWCLDCHRAEQPGELKTRSGRPLPYDAAWQLCADCHPVQITSWRSGIHGKRMESWRGARKLLHCPACHEAHDPAWRPPPMHPLPVQSLRSHP